MNSTGLLKNKVIVITGANSGIGYATAEKVIAEGATAIIVGRDQKKITEAATKLGTKAVAFKADVAHVEEIEALYSFIKNKFGTIHGVVANAAVGTAEPCLDITPQGFDNTMNINVKGAFFTAQKAIPLMTEGGSIIFISSLGAHKAFSEIIVYAASKAAVISFAKNMALELAPLNIRVNSMSPGPTETPIFKKMGLSDEQVKDALADYSNMIPMKRVGQPFEIANVISFLLSEQSSFITGIDILADGGLKG